MAVGLKKTRMMLLSECQKNCDSKSIRSDRVPSLDRQTV